MSVEIPHIPGSHTHLKRAVLSSLSLNVLTNIFLYAGQLLIAQSLPRQEYATYIVVTSFLSLFALIADLGLNPYFVRLFAHAEEEVEQGKTDRRGELLGSFLLMRIILSLLSTVTIIFAALAFGYSASIFTLILLLTPGLLLSARLFAIRSVGDSLLRAQHRLHTSLKFMLLDAVVFAIGAIILKLTDGNLLQTILVYTLCNLPGFLFLILTIRSWMQKQEIRLKVNTHLIRSTLTHGIPLAMGAAFLAIHNNVDSLLLDKLSSPKEVSAYGAGLRILSALVFIPSVLGGIIAPIVSKAFSRNDFATVRSYSQQLLTLLLLAVSLISLVITVIPNILIHVLLGGDKYSDITNIILVFAWSFIPISIATFCSEIAIAEGQMWLPSIYLFFVMVISVVLNVLLIPSYGAFGASLSKGFAVSIGLAIFFVFLKRIKSIDSPQFLITVAKVLLLILCNLTFLDWIQVVTNNKIIILCAIALLFGSLTLVLKLIKYQFLKSILKNFTASE